MLFNLIIYILISQLVTKLIKFKRHKYKNWDWCELSRHKNIKQEDIENNLDFDWNWYWVSQNLNINLDFVIRHDDNGQLI